jgi:hypothetical protein
MLFGNMLKMLREESDKILEKCNDLLEDYIKSHKNDDKNKIRFKGLYILHS